MIDSVSVIRGAVPLTPTRPRQLWLKEWSTQVFVKVEASGETGWGETMPAVANSREPYVALVRKVGGLLLGRDEGDPPSLWGVMRRATYSGGYGVATGAISGIDIALWDIKGKSSGLPLSGMLRRGAPRPVRRYASLSRYRDTRSVVKVVGALLAKGYTFVKLHQKGIDTEAAVKAVREEHGFGFDLAVDLNCSLSLGQARAFVKKASKYELKWVEEPIWPPDDFEGLRELNGLCPVAAGENFFSPNEFRWLLERGALTYYQPDVAKVGGVTPLAKIAKLILEGGGELAFHSRPHNGWIGAMATAHLASAIAPAAYVETPPNEPPPVFGLSGRVTRTEIVPSGPGLGIEPRGKLPVGGDAALLSFH